MPVLKVKKDNGVWQDIATANSHAHTMNDITDLPASLVDDVEALKDKVGAESVAYQISSVIQASEYVHPFTHPADMITGLSTVATSGDYNDLENKPAIPNVDEFATKSYVDEQISLVGGNGNSGGTLEQVQSDWNETDTTSPAYIKNKPTISGDGGISAQPDWNQGDATQPDYIKNRPFYEYHGYTDILPITTYDNFYLNSAYGVYVVEKKVNFALIAGETYKIHWDGNDYECVAQDASMVISGSVAVGNAAAFGLAGNNEPFIIVVSNGYIMPVALTDTTDGGSHVVGISQYVDVVNKIDPKYIPIPFFGETQEIILDYTFTDSDKLSGESTYACSKTSSNTMIIGETYTVICNGVQYELKCFDYSGLSAIGDIDNADIPFVIVSDDTGKILGTPIWALAPKYPNSTSIYDVMIYSNVTQKIETKYLPDDICGLPKVSTSDSGKFLRVSTNGQWIAESIPNAEEASF